jgi:transcription elongation GreA/GreB family factor
MQELGNSINAIEEAIQNETKSTAGDKHETSRAMMQLEREKLGNQLKELSSQKTELERIDISLFSEKVVKGSLVKTDKGSFFIAIALGKTDTGVYVISPQSPLGNKLMGLKQNDKAEINGTTYLIKEIS